jgi:cytoskeletal protein CcmA (bactofilin family)
MFDPNGAGKGEERRERPQEHGPIEVREVGMSGSPGAETTVVGQGARLEGSVVSAGSLRVDGQVKGKVLAEGDVLLSPQSQVEADIEAQNVTVAGRFKGSITVKGRAELTRGSRVEGNIASKTLIVVEGAFFTGQSVMDQQAALPEGSERASWAEPAGVAAPGHPERRSTPGEPERDVQGEAERAWSR